MKLFWQCLAAVLAGIFCAVVMTALFPPKARAAGADREVQWIRHVLLEMQLNGEPVWLELIVHGSPIHATREACVRDAARYLQPRGEGALPVKLLCEERRPGAEFGGEQVFFGGEQVFIE